MALKKLVKESSASELKQISQEMKEIAQQRYTWARISEHYAALFDTPPSLKP